MNKLMKTSVVLGVFALTTGSLAGCGDKAQTSAGGETNQSGQDAGKPKATGSEAALATIQLADGLAQYGLDNQDPAAVALAARIKSGITQEDSGLEASEDDAAPGEEKASGNDYSVEALLAKATEMAPEDPIVTAMVQQAKSGTRGASRGAVKGHVDTVLAGRTDVYNISFRGGQLAQVAVRGDGDTDLDLFIYDENGNKICSDEDYTDRLFCEWTPRWTGNFQVKIKNFGRVYNRYALYTN